MTKTTEELKRDMYKHLNMINICRMADRVPYVSLPDFETALEAYLEALRQERKDLASKNARGHASSLQDQGTIQDLRNRLQAFEFANREVGNRLREAMTTLRRQREFIRTLYTSRKARKSVPGTSGQKSCENATCVKCGGKETTIRAEL